MKSAGLVFVATAILLAACGQRSDKAAALTASMPGEQIVLSVDDYLAQEAYASADARRGETLAMQCRACHSLDRDGGHLVGPNLYRVFGRTAGSAADYEYSEVLAHSGIVWTPRALDAWLAEPFAFLPGHRMSFPGLSDEADRNAVIAYLLRKTRGAAGDST